MAERGLSVDHTWIWRWTQAYGPSLEAAHILVSHVGVAALGLMIGAAIGLAVDNTARTP